MFLLLLPTLKSTLTRLFESCPVFRAGGVPAALQGVIVCSQFGFGPGLRVLVLLGAGLGLFQTSSAPPHINTVFTDTLRWIQLGFIARLFPDQTLNKDLTSSVSTQSVLRKTPSYYHQYL